MQKLIGLLAAILFGLCSCAEIPTVERTGKSFWARVTYYTKHEDRFGNKIACSKYKRAKQGETIAARSIFPFGTKIFIPQLQGKVGNGHFVVEDRGTSVERLKASYGAAEVLDVFTNMTNKAMKRFASTQPLYMPVIFE